VNTPAVESDVRHAESLEARQAALAPDRMLVHLELARWLALAAGVLLAFATVWASFASRPRPNTRLERAPDVAA
jgi:hypothetical protein